MLSLLGHFDGTTNPDRETLAYMSDSPLVGVVHHHLTRNK
jgi:hypothetical protein